ncbi:radical SAM additional 4Fe4S-binding SPASM domain-containing protein [Chryseobacterium oleae]|uniref:Radical SAM additional 4Fe4S-binding SPASM domain-containing protein n=1 Tax=Chryseobacterium oleae TaxID=491207 RepID=A0A1I4XGS2_CHROL|nr:radical SAM protein [Chryseobacterium oleae]SFN24683.1 radical SAM additional 4Fe4S-binding SPASM domain-containing protein [Chryseobacterium oleae]
MKTSNYNIFFPNEDKIVGYNSFSDNFIVLEPILYDLYEASVHEDMVEELVNVHENFYDILVKNGFVIDNEVDELAEIKRISNETDDNDEVFELHINPTMNCNFKCWYCYETHIKDSKMNDTTIQSTVALVDKIIEGNPKLKNFKLYWFGGEPLLYFYKTVVPLFEAIYPKIEKRGIEFFSSFTTNGLLIEQKLLDICKKFGVSNFQITLDGHRERHNKVRFVSEKRGSYDEIVNNIKLGLKNGIHMSVRINISEETLYELRNIIHDFIDIEENEKRFLSFSFFEVWQEEKDLTVDISDIVDEFRNMGFLCNYKGEQIASIRNSCYADKKNQAIINYNGDVYKCTARDFATGSREGVLNDDGTIEWNDKFQKRIYDTKFQNKPCLECKILPLCNGGCSQHRLEHINEEYCVHDFNYESKLSVVKERFYSRLFQKIPKKYELNILNSLLNIDADYFRKKEDAVQTTLTSLFMKQVRESLIDELSDINNSYIECLMHLKQNNFSKSDETLAAINKIQDQLSMNDTEEKVLLISGLPVLAYKEYKLGNYERAIELTNQCIINDDLFIDEHAFLYGHKVQQLHNVIRVMLRQGKTHEALNLGNQILNHLMFGKDIQYIGYWIENYQIENDEEVMVMVYQIFTELVSVISKISLDQEEEVNYYQLAFKNMADAPDVLNEFRELVDFIKIKNSFHQSENIDQDNLEILKNDLLESKYVHMHYPLFKSLFISAGQNSYGSNKEEFEKVYS